MIIPPPLKKSSGSRKKWVQFHHKVVKKVAFWPVYWMCRTKYGFKGKLFPDSNKRQYFIVMNHQTPYDQFFVGMVFRGPIYYVATEDIFSNGFISRLLEWAVAPIPIKKSTADLSVVRNMVQVAKEGGTIALFPEGNRTYSGTTETINPAVAKLIKMLKLPIAVMRLEGGYGCEPRWSSVVRKGPIHASVVRVLEPEEYKAMGNDEFYQVLVKELYVDDAASGIEYHGKAPAEFMERVLYWCPDCGISQLESSGDRITCKKCGKSYIYRPNLTFEGVGFASPFRTMKDWYAAQEAFVSSLDPAQYVEKEVAGDTVDVFKVRVYHSKTRVAKNVRMALYGDRIEFSGLSAPLAASEGAPGGSEGFGASQDSANASGPVFKMPFDAIRAVSVLGRNKLNIYFGRELFQIKGTERFNPVKYLHFYHHYMNRKNGGTGDNHEFLGL